MESLEGAGLGLAGQPVTEGLEDGVGVVVQLSSHPWPLGSAS